MSTKMKMKKKINPGKGKRSEIAIIPVAGKGWACNKQLQDWM